MTGEALVTYLALLRGINLGPHKQVDMTALRNLVAALGFEEVQSLLRSGNLVFLGRKQAGSQLELLLQAEVLKRLDLETVFFIRTAEEWKAVIAANPFPKEAKSDPGHLLVTFLKDPPNPKDVKALQAAIVGREVVRAEGKQAYIVYPDGVGRSRLTNTMIEKKLGTSGTARNWNTVTKLGALADANLTR